MPFPNNIPARMRRHQMRRASRLTLQKIKRESSKLIAPFPGDFGNVRCFAPMAADNNLAIKRDQRGETEVLETFLPTFKYLFVGQFFKPRRARERLLVNETNGSGISGFKRTNGDHFQPPRKKSSPQN